VTGREEYEDLHAGCREVRPALGAYVLGTLEPGEAAHVEGHLPSCPGCTAERDALAPLLPLLSRVSPDEVSNGPVQPGPRLLDRTLEQLAWERRRLRGRRLLAAAAVATVLVGGGAWGASTLASHDGGPGSPGVAATSPGGGRVLAATDAQTGVWARVRMRPSAWGTHVSLSLSGVEEGERCRLVAVARDGERDVAASWKVTYSGIDGLQGGVALQPASILRFDVVTFGGRHLVTVHT